MNERTLELSTALAFLSLTVYFAGGLVVGLLGITRPLSTQLNQIFAFVAIVLTLMTAVMIVKKGK